MKYSIISDISKNLSIWEVLSHTLTLAFDQRGANELDSSLNWFSKCAALPTSFDSFNVHL